MYAEEASYNARLEHSGQHWLTHVAISGHRTTWQWTRHTLHYNCILSAHLPTGPTKENKMYYHETKQPERSAISNCNTTAVMTHTWHHSKQYLRQEITLLRFLKTSHPFLYSLTDLLRPLYSPNLNQLRKHPTSASNVQKATVLSPLPHHGAYITSFFPQPPYWYKCTFPSLSDCQCYHTPTLPN
jgi:hypothetical protein